jgi:hypothetical protein
MISEDRISTLQAVIFYVFSVWGRIEELPAIGLESTEGETRPSEKLTDANPETRSVLAP